MDSPPWYFLWGVPATNDGGSNGALDDDATLAANVFYASTLNVILQRLMPLYRLRQTGVSTTLLPSATHWTLLPQWRYGFPADHSQLGVVARMTTRVETSYLGGTPHSLNVILQRHTQQAVPCWRIHDFVANGNAY